MDVRPYPRIRKTIKYAGAALTVLLVVVWVGGKHFAVRWSASNGNELIVWDGQILFVQRFEEHTNRVPPPLTVFLGATASALEFWRAVHGSSSSRMIPLWPIAIGCLLLTALAFRLDTLARRRNRMNLCPKCRYDRTGLPGGATTPCPECGTAGSSPKGGGMFIARR